jgi:hypothetical protein
MVMTWFKILHVFRCLKQAVLCVQSQTRRSPVSANQFLDAMICEEPRVLGASPEFTTGLMVEAEVEAGFRCCRYFSGRLFDRCSLWGDA